MDICLKNIECVRILCIYHPPDDSTYPLLSERFSRFLELFLAEYSKSLIIADDFNLHLGDPRDRNAKRFLDIMDIFGLRQHVYRATHKRGHTSDLLITRSEGSWISRVIIRHSGIANHYAVHCDLRLQKLCFVKKTVTSRKLCSIDMDSLCRDICDSSLFQDQSEDLNAFTEQYDDILCSILNNLVITKGDV